jgi:hypothetical protein
MRVLSNGRSRRPSGLREALTGWQAGHTPDACTVERLFRGCAGHKVAGERVVGPGGMKSLDHGAAALPGSD